MIVADEGMKLVLPSLGRMMMTFSPFVVFSPPHFVLVSVCHFVLLKPLALERLLSPFAILHFRSHLVVVVVYFCLMKNDCSFSFGHHMMMMMMVTMIVTHGETFSVCDLGLVKVELSLTILVLIPDIAVVIVVENDSRFDSRCDVDDSYKIRLDRDNNDGRIVRLDDNVVMKISLCCDNLAFSLIHIVVMCMFLSFVPVFGFVTALDVVDDDPLLAGTADISNGVPVVDALDDGPVDVARAVLVECWGCKECGELHPHPSESP